jgi:phosphoribosylformylglycinamidine synthase
MTTVKALILTGYGLNCDHETAYVFDQAGATSQRVHINSLIKGDVKLSDYQIMAFVGGFSWGDDHGAGVIQAIRMKTHLENQIQAFMEKGNLIIGICSGFQTLVNMGVLPGGGTSMKRSVAFLHNDMGNFRNDWVHLKVNTNSPCVFTRDMDFVEYPIRHGEGKFYAETKRGTLIELVAHFTKNEPKGEFVIVVGGKE